MTNKIKLSFKYLYTFKNADYSGATLSYRIKHGDQLLAEGDIKGKTFSPFVLPITIKETDITQLLTVEYVCTGSVEDVSVSVGPSLDLDSRTLADCKKRFAGSEPLPFGGFPAAISIAVETDDELSKEDQLKKLVNEIVDVQIKKGLQPDGLLYRR